MPAFDDIVNDPPQVICPSFMPEHCGKESLEIQPFRMVDLLETAREPAKWQEFFRLLHSAYLNGESWDSVLALGNGDAQLVINSLQLSLDMPLVRKQDTCFRQALYLLVKLVEKTQRLPESLSVHGVELTGQDLCKRGGFADIYRGTYKDIEVAIKRLFFSETNRTQNEKAFYREALVWRQLDHEHVLRFIGVDEETFPPSSGFAMCMISPWMSKGTLHSFVRSQEYSPADDCYRLIREIASALVYLHSHKIVHGDIHPANVLIDCDKHAKLADFGLSIVGDKTKGRMSSAYDSAGAAHYLAPDRVNATPDHKRRSTAGDVYAFACICYFVHVRNHPFHNLDEPSVTVHVFLANRPSFPQETEPELTDRMWHLIQRAWTHKPEERPSMIQVERCLELVTSSPNRSNSHGRSYSFESDQGEGWEILMRE